MMVNRLWLSVLLLMRRAHRALKSDLKESQNLLGDSEWDEGTFPEEVKIQISVQPLFNCLLLTRAQRAHWISCWT